MAKFNPEPPEIILLPGDKLGGPQPIPIGFSYNSTLPHAYACFTWVSASVSTRGDAGALIDASFTVPSFDVSVP